MLKIYSSLLLPPVMVVGVLPEFLLWSLEFDYHFDYYFLLKSAGLLEFVILLHDVIL